MLKIGKYNYDNDWRMEFRRIDSRKQYEMRTYAVELGISKEADGSSRFSQGDTEILATITGPTQPKYSRHEKFDVATIDLDFSILGSAGAPNSSSSRFSRNAQIFLTKSLQSCIQLDKYPRQVINIHVCVIKNCGGLLSTALNACVTALIDAGIQMNSVPLSTSIVFSASNSIFLLDPNLEEEETMESLLIFVSTPSTTTSDTENIVNSICTGSSLSVENLLFAADLSCRISTSMRQFIRDLIFSDEE